MPTSNFTAKLLELEELIISDFTSSNTEIHILPSRSQVSLQQYFQGFQNKKEVQFIVMDMNKVYRESEDLAAAYHLKELFYDFMKSKSRAEATKKLKFFLLAAQASQLKEFHACLTMLGNWSKYILNAFDCPYTNGFTEGTNNAIKVIKRNAFGYRNFENFRNRIFLALT